MAQALTGAALSTPDAARDREGGILGIFGAVIALASLPVAPPWPAADAPVEEIRAYFTAHGHALLLQTILLSFGFVLLLRLYGGMVRLLARAGAESLAWTTLAGLAISTVAILVGNAPWAVLAYRTPADAGLLLALWDLGLISAFTLVGPCLAAFWLPLGLGVLRTRVLPASYGYAVLAASVVHLAAGVGFARGGAFSPNGALALASILAHVACTIAAVVLMLRRAR